MRSRICCLTEAERKCKQTEYVGKAGQQDSAGNKQNGVQKNPLKCKASGT